MSHPKDKDFDAVMELIRRQHRHFGIEYTGKPRVLDYQESAFIVRALEEEVREYNESPSLVDDYDALLDIIVFAVGALARQGLPLLPGILAVVDANMKKTLGPNKDKDRGEFKLDLVKPPGWRGPEEDLQAIIDRLKYPLPEVNTGYGFPPPLEVAVDDTRYHQQQDVMVSDSTFVKHDSDKSCLPRLIPLNFREAVDEPHKDIDITGHWFDIMKSVRGAEREPYSWEAIAVAAADLKKFYEDTTHKSFWLGIGRVMTLGAKKYKPNNWLLCPFDERQRYIDAFYRHMWEWQEQELDSETSESHLLHAGCCLLMWHGIVRKHLND